MQAVPTPCSASALVVCSLSSVVCRLPPVVCRLSPNADQTFLSRLKISSAAA